MKMILALAVAAVVLSACGNTHYIPAKQQREENSLWKAIQAPCSCL